MVGDVAAALEPGLVFYCELEETMRALQLQLFADMSPMIVDRPVADMKLVRNLLAGLVRSHQAEDPAFRNAQCINANGQHSYAPFPPP